MRRIALLTLLLASGGVTADDGTAGVELDVQPLLCIVDRRRPTCDMDFLIAWQSAVTGSYCLFSQRDSPLRCWRDAQEGRHKEQREVAETFQFWLSHDGDAEPLAAVTVEVMSTESSDRRRQRRSRHVWDIL